MTGSDLLSRIAAVEERIDCGGAQHRLAWAAGTLTAPDHPDPHGERVLGGLGASRPYCLEVLDAWAAHDDDLRVLTVGPRHSEDQVGVDVAAVEAVRHGGFARSLDRQRTQQLGMGPAAVGARPVGLPSVEEQTQRLRRHLELLTLFTLPAALQRRLLATVAAGALHRPGRSSDPAMTAALVGRGRVALRSWAGEGSEVDVRLGPGATVTRDGRRVAAELPAEWLVAVWGAELAVVDGHFVCAVLESGPERCTVRAVTPGGEEVEVRLLRASDRGPWAVSPRGG